MVGGVIAFLFGLVYGSFLNVVSYRFDDWLSIIKTRSHCRECKKTLAWYDLVPLISFVALKGKCRYCQKPISWQYPIVELIAACLVTAGYFAFLGQAEDYAIQSILVFAFYVLSVGSLIVIFLHDLAEKYISDYLTYFLIIVATGFSLLYYQDWQLTLMGAFISTLPIALIVYPSGGRWMGEGDVKLALGLGLLVGYPGAVVALNLAFIIGGIVGAIALSTKKAKLRTAVPFAPFLIIGALIALFYAPLIVDWYLGVIGYGWYY